MDLKFKEKIKKNTALLDELNNKYKNLGNLKTIIFILMIFAFFLYTKNDYFTIIGFILGIILIILFIIQYKFKKKIDYHEKIISINKDFIKRINGEWISFKDIGSEYIDSNHNYSLDLDIVGSKSLFQLINVTNTFLGRNRLADNLLKIDSNKDEILKKQDSTKELADKIDFCQDFIFNTGNINDNENILEIIDYLKNANKFISNNIVLFIYKLLPVVTIPIFFASVLFKLEILIPIFTTLFIIQIFLFIFSAYKCLAYIQGLSHYTLKFFGYIDLFILIEKTEFNSELLNQLKDKLFKEKSAIIAIKELNSINEKINLRNNIFLFLALNIGLLWDFDCCIKLYEWKLKYGSFVFEWFDTIANFESLICFSVLNNVTENNSYPTIKDDEKVIEAKQIGHPLLKNDLRIYNDFSINDNILIISGSNMSGKTTFLRTIGINLVLAYNGSVVCSTNFSAPILKIITSMRIIDNLSEGISTFYAELLKIKNIITESRENDKVLFFIDEIFRGTNSKDRLYGAKTVIENLNNFNVMGFITTHDLEVCDLDKNKRIINYHFKEEYKDKEISFDYKLYKGISKTTNGTALMKMIGIIE